jgi:hypothetical protein
MSISDIIKQEDEFRKFDISISEPMNKSFFNMTFKNGEVEFGVVACVKYKDYYEILNVTLKTDYQCRGYAKFMYKSALEHAKRNGKLGLLSGKSLAIPEDKLNSIYSHFNHDKIYINNTSKGRREVLTDWIEK